MSCVAVDIAGQRFGRLMVIEQAGRDKWGQVRWKCQCDCGRLTVVASAALRKANTVSCGCARGRSHGVSQTPEYRSYLAMIRRCTDSTHRAYRWYGGRGIQVCDRWREDPAAFVKDLGPRPEGTTLDRIDSEKDYGPENCRWATWDTQAHNKRKRLPPLPLLGG